MSKSESFAVHTEALTKTYITGNDITHALDGIDLDLSFGQLLMLVGPSGCGKTTLLSVMTGILTPTSGKVFVNNVELTSLSDEQKVLFRRKNIGFIFQQFHLFNSLTVVENVIVPLIADNIPKDLAIQKAVTLLNNLDMEDCLDKLPSQLSGGQQQRVTIARALIHEPLLLVCDEPTSALDAHTGHNVMENLRNVALNSGRTVLVVTHDNRIFHFADRILYMEDGRIIGEDQH